MLSVPFRCHFAWSVVAWCISGASVFTLTNARAMVSRKELHGNPEGFDRNA
jgi:hypothetical protein